MKKKAVHIYYSTFENESRILKETKSLITHRIVDEVIVLGKGKEGLSAFEEFDTHRFVYRISFRLKKGEKIPVLNKLLHLLKPIDVFLQYVLLIKKAKPVYVNIHQVMLLPLITLIRLVSPKSLLIYDAHELETESNGLNGWKQRLFKFIEKRFIRSFKLIIVVGPAIEQWYRNEYKIDNVVTVMNCPVYQPVQKKDYFREEFGISSASKIYLYQGALFYGRGVEVMLEAFARINDPEFTLILMGYGEMIEDIKKVADRFPNIYFKPAVHPSIVLEYTSSADVGISLIENVCLSYYYCLPNKLFEYLMAEIPCIVSNMKEMSDYVHKNTTGIVCSDITPEALMRSVKDVVQFDFKEFHDRIEAVKKEYSWSNQESVMIEAYKKLDKSNGN